MGSLAAHELLPHLADLLELRDDPVRFALRVIDMLLAHTSARGAAVLVIEDGEPRPLASHHLDRGALETIRIARRLLSEPAVPLYVADRDTDRRVPGDLPGTSPRSFALFRIPAAPEGEGLLYLDSDQPCFLGARNLTEGSALAALLVRPVRLELALAQAPLPARGAPQRDVLIQLLEQNRWNISRVARIAGVTRRTVYMRLSRWEIRRERPQRKQQPLPAAS